MATVPMPEAPMDEDRLAAPPEYNIGLSGKVLGMEAVAVAEGVEKASNGHLRACVLRPDCAHYTTAFFRREGVFQSSPSGLESCASASFSK